MTKPESAQSIANHNGKGQRKELALLLMNWINAESNDTKNARLELSKATAQSNVVIK